MHESSTPPDTAYMGGAWERIIRSIKIAIKIILGNIMVGDSTLSTVLSQVECLINSRPLTPVSDDINDFEAITLTSHFLIGRANMNLQSSIVYDDDVDHRRRWK